GVATVAKNVRSFSVGQGGALYWLSKPVTGGWLEMRLLGSRADNVLATNVSGYLLQSSGSLLALAAGKLIEFAPGSTVMQTLDSGVTSFAVDGSGSVVALDSSSTETVTLPSGQSSTVPVYNLVRLAAGKQRQVMDDTPVRTVI